MSLPDVPRTIEAVGPSGVEVHRASGRSLSRLATAAALVSCILFAVLRAEAALPLLAQDLKSPLFNPATGKAEHPATVDLIRGARGLFLANTNSASDALYLADHDSLDFVHYIGFTNLWFEGLGYIRPGGTASMPEEAFYHTTDPATSCSSSLSNRA